MDPGLGMCFERKLQRARALHGPRTYKYLIIGRTNFGQSAPGLLYDLKRGTVQVNSEAIGAIAVLQNRS